MDNLNTFLTWLYAGGGSIVVISWVMERIPWFQQQTSTVREYLMFGLSVLVGIGSFAIIQYVPQDVLNSLTPYFQIIASVFGVVFLGKAFHRLDKR